jgi:hypothetical protein
MYSTIVLTSIRAQMEDFFDVCIGKIVEMIKLHMDSIEERGSVPKASQPVIHNT